MGSLENLLIACQLHDDKTRRVFQARDGDAIELRFGRVLETLRAGERRLDCRVP